MKISLCLLLLAFAPVAAAQTPGPSADQAAAGPYQVQSIVLYQTTAEMTARLGPTGVAPLAGYIARIDAAAAPIFAAAVQQPGVSGALVIGLKPNGGVRCWVAERPGALPDTLVTQLQTAIEAIPAIAVQAGPVAFAIRFNAWGGGAPITDAAHPAPIPRAWLAGATGPEQVPDGVFARIWP